MSDQFDLGGLLEQAQAMQQQLLEAQARAAEEEVEAEAGGGVVKIRVTGGLDFRSVKIDPKVVDPNDVELLEDLVLAAIREAVAEAQLLTAEAMGGLGDLMGAMGGGLPGLTAPQDSGGMDPSPDDID